MIPFGRVGRSFGVLAACILFTLSGCSSQKTTAVVNVNGHDSEQVHFQYEAGGFSVNIPPFIHSRTDLITEQHNQSYSNQNEFIYARLLVNFGPKLPDTTLLTVQIAPREAYDERNQMGYLPLFSAEPATKINDEMARSFFKSLLFSIRQSALDKSKRWTFSELALDHFTHRKSDVIYAVYQQIAEQELEQQASQQTPEALGATPKYHVFYLTQMEEQGVLVWLQVPITGNELDGRSMDRLMNRTWDLQNDFFESLVLN